MYMFDLLAEYYLPQDKIVEYQSNFMQVFKESMKDTQPRVRIAAFKALTSFLTSIEEEETVLQYSSMMAELLDIVVEVLKTDEE